MTEPNEALAEAQRGLAYYQAQVESAQAAVAAQQQASEQPDPQQQSSQVPSILPNPKDAAINAHREAIERGATEETASGLAVAALARGALQGDDRYVYRTPSGF